MARKLTSRGVVVEVKRNYVMIREDCGRVQWIKAPKVLKVGEKVLLINDPFTYIWSIAA
jgi:hypothetical protein